MRQPMNLNYPNTKSGKMIKNRLRTIKRLSTHLHELLMDADDVPDWVIGKVATATDKLSVVSNYLISKMEGKLLRPNGQLEDLEEWMIQNGIDEAEESIEILQNPVNFIVQGAMIAGPYLVRMAKYLPTLGKTLRPYAKQIIVAVKNGLKTGRDFLPEILVILQAAQQAAPNNAKMKQLNEMASIAEGLDRDLHRIERGKKKV